MASSKDGPGSSPSRPADAGVKRPYATIDVTAREIAREIAGEMAGEVAGETAPGGAAAENVSAASAASPAAKDMTRRFAATLRGATKVLALVRRGASPGFLTHLAAGAGGALLVLMLAEALPSRPTHGPQVGPQVGPEVGPEARPEMGREIGELTRRLALEAAARQQEQGQRQELARAVALLTEGQTGLSREIAAVAGKNARPVDLPPELGQRLAKLEEGLAAIANTHPQSPPAALATRLAELEKSVHETSDAVTSGLARFDAALSASRSDEERLAQGLSDLKQETAEQWKGAARVAEVTPLGAKLAVMERELKALLGNEAGRAVDTSRLILGLELAELRRAADRGEDVSTELARLQKSAGAGLDLSAVAAAMREGVPSTQELARSFHAAANAMVDAEHEPANATLIERLLSGARSIVRIRKTGHAAADASVEAVIERMEAALQQGRLGEALVYAKSLPPKAELAGEDWLRKARARVAIDQAIADAEAALKTSLAGGNGDARR
jgi:Mitochondrial inner membrane protein